MIFDNDTIRIAIRLYLSNEVQGIKTYGHINSWDVSNVSHMFENTKIAKSLIKYNLSNKQFFQSPENKQLYHELFIWPRQNEYMMSLINNYSLPSNNILTKHKYHPISDNTDITRYMTTYL